MARLTCPCDRHLHGISVAVVMASFMTRHLFSFANNVLYLSILILIHLYSRSLLRKSGHQSQHATAQNAQAVHLWPAQAY